jgi:protein SCO1
MKPILIAWLLIAAAMTPASGRYGSVPDPLWYAYHEQPGTQLPGQLLFLDSDARPVHLSELSDGLPLIVVLTYFRCTSMCGLVRSSLFKALAAANLQAGRNYTLAVLSIDSRELSAEASAAKAADKVAFGPWGDDSSVHYLTGQTQAIQAVADAVGFRDRFDAASSQFIHPTGAVFVTPAGRVSNYLLGVGYEPAAMRSALAQAAAGGIATAASPLLLICFHFDPTTGRYSLAILKLLRLAAVIAALTVAALLMLLYRRERKGL